MPDIVVLFFVFGLLAGLVKSELKLPSALYDSLSVFLLIAIGLKGGQGLAQQSVFSLAPQLLAVITLGIIQTLIAFSILKYLCRFDRANAAATAAHYGSVSVATFAVGSNWLMTKNIGFESQMAVFLAVMEIPAIMAGIILVRGVKKGTDWRQLAHETFFGKGVTLLLGGMIIGWIAGPDGLSSIKGLFFDLFKGALALFLMEMGLIVAKQVGDLRRNGIVIIAFGITMPLISAVLGMACGVLIGLSAGGITLLAVLAASASYIAVPATMRLAGPEANPALSLSAVLGITFPFNIIIGIPLYHHFAQMLTGVSL